MDVLRTLLTTDAGLMSLGVILFMLCMAGFIYWRLRKFMREEPPAR